MTGQDDDTTPLDRRTGGRAPIAREALFSDASGRGPLHEAAAVDVGAEGMQLLSPVAVQPGRRLHIELHPASGIGHGAPLLLDATVVYCHAADAPGSFRVGLSFETRLPAPQQGAETGFLEAAREANTGLPVRFAEALEPRRGGMRWRWTAALLLLFAGLLGLLTGLTLFRDPDALSQRRRPAVAEPGTPEALTALRNQLTDDKRPIPSRTFALVDALRPLFPDSAPPSTLDEAYALLIAGRLEEARAAFAAIGARAGLTPVERFRAKLGTAQSLAALGERVTAAPLAVELIAESTPAVPEPWRDAAARLNEVLTRGRLDIEGELLGSELTLGSRSSADADPNPPAAGVYLDIDKSDFVLSVYRDGKAEARYPIGIGAGDSTPEGRFTVANKIGHPTWYNKGNPVPPGDPRNPLGDHWLGLAAEGIATAYGIHGAVDPASVGTEASAGCIRMRAADVESVFGAAEVGTPVFIRP